MKSWFDQWCHRQTGWSELFAAQDESLLALSNGYLGIRGTLDEGEPNANLGTYLNGFYETRPIQYADPGYGDPSTDQVLVNVTDGTRIRLFVEGAPLDIRVGTVLEHERTLDLRAGVLTRSLLWRSPAGHEVRVLSRRLVSLEYRELAMIEYRVEAISGPIRLEIISELGVRIGGATDSGDPRAGAELPPDTLIPTFDQHHGRRAVLAHHTRFSGQHLAAGMDHLLLEGPPGAESLTVLDGVLARWTLTTAVEPGQPLGLVKLLAYHWSSNGDRSALAAEVDTSLDRARTIGSEELMAAQRAALDEVWARADIEIDGDSEIQHALRYALFQLHQNSVHAAGHGIPAKGLTGAGYNGHSFWDTEIFLLPLLTYCAPEIAASALRWRASTLSQAQAKAHRLGLAGAAFPWRTIGGEECSGYLPAGTAAFHVNADIAHAVVDYIGATADVGFERETGAPLLVETARMWASLGYHDQRRGGRFSIDGVTGPDEYSALVDNNLYTNLMARANLRAAADVAERLAPDTLGVAPGEVAAWRRAADAMTIPFDPELGIHLQDEDFARHAPFDFDATPPQDYPLLLHVSYFQLYRHQVVKQPDVVLAMALCGDSFTQAEKRANFAHYEALTVRDSSLAAGTQAILAAEIGDVQLAYDYLAEAALLDHRDSAHNTADGLHLSALAGGWMAIVLGLGGARQYGGRLSFAPRLPEPLTRVAFPFCFLGRHLRIEITTTEARYRLLSGAPLQIDHWGAPLTLTEAKPEVRAIPPAAAVPVLRQPYGRAPSHRLGPAIDRPPEVTHLASPPEPLPELISH
ncbi:MAG: glycoside hydrolase family 65 protein [Candidatus Dormibacteria bacterium]